MSEINKINLTILNTYRSNFINEKDNYKSNAHTTFFNGYISNCSDSTVAIMHNKLREKYLRIEKAYQQIESWWTSYIDNLQGIENFISDNGSAGSISESLLRSYLISQLEKLPDYSPDFTKLQFRESSNFEFATDTFNEVKRNNDEFREKQASMNSDSQNSVGDKVSSFFSGIFIGMGNFFENTGAAISTKTESVWSGVKNWWSDITTREEDLFKDTSAKVSDSTTSSLLVKDEEITAPKDYTFEQLTNPDFDNTKTLGIFGKNITYGPNGVEILFDKKVKEDDGSIIYYKDGNIVKWVRANGEYFSICPNGNSDKIITVYSDGKTVITEIIADVKIETTYNIDGSYSIRESGDHESGLPYSNEKVYTKEGILIKEIVGYVGENPSITEYYENGNIKTIIDADGKYQNYDINGLLIEEKKDIEGPNGISIGCRDVIVKYDGSGNIISMLRDDGSTFREYGIDGSFIQYDNEGEQIYAQNADGSYKYITNWRENEEMRHQIMSCDSDGNVIEEQWVYNNGDIRIINNESDITYDNVGSIICENNDYGAINYEGGKPVSLDFSKRPFGGYTMSGSASVKSLTINNTGNTYILKFNFDGTKLISIEDFNGNITSFGTGIDFIR